MVLAFLRHLRHVWNQRMGSKFKVWLTGNDTSQNKVKANIFIQMVGNSRIDTTMKASAFVYLFIKFLIKFYSTLFVFQNVQKSISSPKLVKSFHKFQNKQWKIQAYVLKSIMIVLICKMIIIEFQDNSQQCH